MNYCKQTVKCLQTTDPLPSASSVLFHVEVMKFQWWLHVAAFRWGQCQKDVLHTTGLLTTVVCADVSDSCLYSSYCDFGSLGFSFFPFFRGVRGPFASIFNKCTAWPKCAVGIFRGLQWSIFVLIQSTLSPYIRLSDMCIPTQYLRSWGIFCFLAGNVLNSITCPERVCTASLFVKTILSWHCI